MDSQFKIVMEGYWPTNPGSADPTVVWDAFKAFSRGQFQTIIAKVRNERRSALTTAESAAAIQEMLYVGSRDPQHYIRLQCLTREVLSLRTSLTQKTLLAESQRIFEQGERSEKLLALLSREQFRGFSIPHILGPSGDLLYTPEEINNCFVTYYKTLYSSKVE